MEFVEIEEEETDSFENCSRDCENMSGEMKKEIRQKSFFIESPNVWFEKWEKHFRIYLLL